MLWIPLVSVQLSAFSSVVLGTWASHSVPVVLALHWGLYICLVGSCRRLDLFSTLQLHKYFLSYIIIIMLCHRHRYPWLSLTTSPYRSSCMAGLQGCIPYPQIAAGCMFELVVLLLPGYMWGSIGVHHLWARPCFSSSDLHVWFI